MMMLLKRKINILLLIFIVLTITTYLHFNLNQTTKTTKTTSELLRARALGAHHQYPPRINMGECPPLFGKVLVFVAFSMRSMKTHYKVAQESLECYLKTTNYSVAMVDLDTDERVQNECGGNSHIFFKKHCAAAAYLRDTDWMLVLDADTGVVNPNHCIEEWIDDRVDLIFYERFFNWEIACGNYIVRNSQFSLDFLKKWADWEYKQHDSWTGADNGVLHLHILQTVLPSAQQQITNCDRIWRNATTLETYLGYVTCCKLALGATRLWPGKLRIYRRAHGWVRDGFLTADRFCERDFMMHGWKAMVVGDDGWGSPFQHNLNVSLCGNKMNEWDYRPMKNTSCENIRLELASYEKQSGEDYPKEAQMIPHLMMPDVGECYPHCDDGV